MSAYNILGTALPNGNEAVNKRLCPQNLQWGVGGHKNQYKTC